MAAGKIASWAFGEEFLDEDLLFSSPGLIARARERGSALGLPPVLAGSAAHVRSVVALSKASSIVEVGTGSGVLSLYIVSGMSADATLTTIDPEPENLRLARESFTEAGIAGARVRTINGQATAVFSRLTPRAYDVVVVPADHEDIEALTDRALTLMRPGGVLLIVNVMNHDRLADPVQSDEVTTRVRSVVRSFQEDERCVCSLSPAGDGVLTAVLQEA